MDIPKTPTRQSRLLVEYYGTVFFLMLLAFFGVAFFILKPKVDEIKATNTHVETTLLVLDADRAYLNSLEQSIGAAQNISPTVLDEVDQALPRDSRIPELLVLFGSTAERDGVRVTNIAFADTRVTNTAVTTSVAELQISLNVNAISYPQIKRFLRDIEGSLRLMDIIGINVSTHGEESAYAIQLKTYTYRPPAKAAPTTIQR